MAGYGRKERAISHLLAGASNKDAAKLAQVSERQLYRYLLEPGFQAELNRRQSAIIMSVSRSLSLGCEQAVITLREFLEDVYPHNVRLKAAQAILALALNYHEKSEIERGLVVLENGRGEIVVNWQD